MIVSLSWIKINAYQIFKPHIFACLLYLVLDVICWIKFSWGSRVCNKKLWIPYQIRFLVQALYLIDIFSIICIRWEHWKRDVCLTVFDKIVSVVPFLRSKVSLLVFLFGKRDNDAVNAVPIHQVENNKNRRCFSSLGEFLPNRTEILINLGNSFVYIE